MTSPRDEILSRIRSCGSIYGVTASELVVPGKRSRASVGAALKALTDEGLIFGEKIATGKAGRPPLAYYPAAND